MAPLARVLLSSLLALTGLASVPAAEAGEPAATRPWTVRKANAWLKRAGWLVGSNYVPVYNWGFVAGKTQTIYYPWESWSTAYTAEPAVWFHDIFRSDGSPYDPVEIEYIRSVTTKPPA